MIQYDTTKSGLDVFELEVLDTFDDSMMLMLEHHMRIRQCQLSAGITKLYHMVPNKKRHAKHKKSHSSSRFRIRSSKDRYCLKTS